MYHTETLEEAKAVLLRLGEKWKDKSPAIYALWERNWENITTIFTYPSDIRRVIYTTNAIESLNGVIRSRIKTKRILGSSVWLPT
ncbi:MAG: transposase [Synergistaceae bacterium]|nr:transposase [Synergistaceae bacterium]